MLYRAKNIKVDINGNVYHILSSAEYRLKLLEISTIIILAFFVYIFQHFKYVPVTVVGNTIYAKVIAATVHQQQIEYRLCKTNNRIIVYETSDGNLIPFEGITSAIIEKNLPVIVCDDKDLSSLEEHTNLDNLADVQRSILEHFEQIDGTYIANLNKLLTDVEYGDPIISIERIASSLYYIRTTEDIWLTNFILSDMVEPLRVGETIIGCVVDHVTDNISTNKLIQRTPDSAIIRDGSQTLVMNTRALYYVEDDLSITSYPRHKLGESKLYSLEPARPFATGGVYIIHPFHLPSMLDPLLPIMIVTTAIVTH